MSSDVLLQQFNPYSLDSIETITYDPNLYNQPNQIANYTQYQTNSYANESNTTYDNKTHSDYFASDSIDEVKDDDYLDLDDMLHVYYSGESYKLMVGDTSDTDDFNTSSLFAANPDSEQSKDANSDAIIKREASKSEHKEENTNKGDLQFLLITSFIDGEKGTGKVWTVPKDFPENGNVLIAGLQKPTGVCFDVHNKFLYVVDPGFDNNGSIYQYEIKWNKDHEFVLNSDSYFEIVEGAAPYDCSVDQYGNLFYVDSIENKINVVSYTELWNGNKNQQVSLYAGTDEKIPISYPVAIDVINSKDLWYVNSLKCDVYGLLDYAQADTDSLNDESISGKVYNEHKGWGVAVTESNYAFFTISTGEVFAYDIESGTETHLKSKEVLQDPRGLCYGDGLVFVADFKEGIVYKLHDNDQQEQPEKYVRIQGAYNIFCVNSSSSLIFSLVSILIILIF